MQQRRDLGCAGCRQARDRILISGIPIAGRSIAPLGAFADAPARRVAQFPKHDQRGFALRRRHFLYSADELITADARGLVARRDLPILQCARHCRSELFGCCPRQPFDRSDRDTGAVAQGQDRRASPRHIVGKRVRQRLAARRRQQRGEHRAEKPDRAERDRMSHLQREI